MNAHSRHNIVTITSALHEDKPLTSNTAGLWSSYVPLGCPWMNTVAWYHLQGARPASTWQCSRSHLLRFSAFKRAFLMEINSFPRQKRAATEWTYNNENEFRLVGYLRMRAMMQNRCPWQDYVVVPPDLLQHYLHYSVYNFPIPPLGRDISVAEAVLLPPSEMETSPMAYPPPAGLNAMATHPAASPVGGTPVATPSLT